MRNWTLTSTAILAVAAGLASGSLAAAAQSQTPGSMSEAAPAQGSAPPVSTSVPGRGVATPTPAAVETSTAGQGIQDIIVTASRREQSLQKTALPVTAITGAELSERGVSNVQQLSKLTPALKIGSVGAGVLQITARGVGTFGGNSFNEPGVSVNLDGAYIANTAGPEGIFYDVARVELLKGPQGTLYGRNSTGGVLNIITNDPTDQFGGDVTIETGNYGLKRASGAINIPITAGVALRVAGQGVDRDGYLSDGYNDNKGYAGRTKLKVDVVPNLSILLEANYTAVLGKGYSGVFSPFVDPKNPYLGPSTPLSNTTFNIPGIGPLLPRIKDNGFLNNRQRGLQGTINYSSDWFKATLIVNNIRSTTNYLQYASSFPVSDDTRDTPSYSTTAELRLASAGSGPLKWVVGGFYFQNRTVTNAFVNQGFTYADSRDLVIHTKSYSGFGEATYAITNGIRLTAGARYTSDRKSLDGITLGPPNPCGAPSVPGNDPVDGPVCITSDTGSHTFGKFTYKLGAEADIGPRSMVYANYATGFKSGGFFASANFAQPGDFPSNAYKPEELSAWTIGSKNRFLDNTLQINAEGFYWKYKNKQVSHLGFVPPNNLILLVDNAANATIYGAEVEAQWQPTSHDNFGASVAYTHSKYDEYLYNAIVTAYANPVPPGAPAPGPVTGCSFSPTVGIGGAPEGVGVPGLSTVNCSGKTLTLTPKWVATLSYRHVFDLAGGGTLVPSVSTNIESGYFIGGEYYNGEYQSSYSTTDFAVTFTPASKGFSVTGFVSNIENAVIGETASLNSTIGVATVVLRPPRTYGVRVNVKF